MAKVRSSSSSAKPKRRTPIDPEARENLLVSYAYDLAEQRLLEGTASSQEVVHFLKLGSQKHQREMEKLTEENRLLKAKTEQMGSMKNIEDLYEKAIKAMRNYSGQGDEDEYEDY